MNNPEENSSAQTDHGKDMEPINDFDQNHFYDHDRLDENAFGEENRSNEDLGYQEISGTASLADRIHEDGQMKQKDIHVPIGHELPTKADGDKLMDVGRDPDS